MNDHAKVLFFATIREKTGVREINIEFPQGARISFIKVLLMDLYPNLKQSMDSIIIAMNHEFAFDEYIVPDGAEIALFPPVSGGTGEKAIFPTLINLTDQIIDINSILEQISSETTGAACIFSGIVRGFTKRGITRETVMLEYEAYQIMAEAKMREISMDIRSRWEDIEGIALIQRIGKISSGEVSVVIACTSSHRDSGIFEAARYGIDRLKEIVPIWKKEIGSDGAEWIEGDHIPQKGR